MTALDVLTFLGLWGAFMGVGIIVDQLRAKKKPGVTAPGRDERN